MPANHRQSLIQAAFSLKDLLSQTVFTGGSVLPAFVDDPTAPPPRTGNRVEVIADVPHQAAWMNWQNRLHELGFEPQSQHTWRKDQVVLSVIPAHLALTSGKGRWYEEGLFNATSVGLAPNLRVRVLSMPYLLAYLLENIPPRTDLRFSPDWEDLVYLLAYCPNLPEMVAKAYFEVRETVKKGLASIQAQPLLEENVFYALGNNASSSQVRHVKQALVLAGAQRTGR